MRRFTHILFLAAASSLVAVDAFSVPPRWARLTRAVKPPGGRITGQLASLRLYAKKAKKKGAAAVGGGGFGVKAPAKAPVNIISADKTSLERQWDVFASITNLEIAPKEDDDDFRVVDVFVRSGSSGEDSGGTKWFRIGKVVATEGHDVDAALTLQKGLIFWTAVHMRRELVAAGGKSGAAALELGYSEATVYMGTEADGPVDDDEAERIEISGKISVKDVPTTSVGFRPDWNPPGFTYKRREKAAMKKKRSKLDELTAD